MLYIAYTTIKPTETVEGENLFNDIDFLTKNMKIHFGMLKKIKLTTVL